MLVAYNAAGEVTAILDHLVARDAAGRVIGLVDFAAQEVAGELTDVWNVEGAAGSGTWPEWLGAKAHDFRVERANGRITALVHKSSGQRRERAAIEEAIEAVEPDDKGRRDIRHIVGGPDRPLLLDDEGRTTPREPRSRPNLPVIGMDKRR
jgi:hypothetical protein